MSLHVFVSAVSNEFHHFDPRRPQAFQSYRQVLRQSLRNLLKGVEARTQEDLVQGYGDLLTTLDDEVRCAHIVVHLVGDLAGATPEAAELRRLRERYPEWLAREPELAALVGDGDGVSYTQWEAYLAFHHGRNRLVFRIAPSAPRSPRFVLDEKERASQQKHFERLRAAGEHYAVCFDQCDLARKACLSVERYGLRPDAPPLPSPQELAAAREQAQQLTSEIGSLLRAAAKTAASDHDPAGVEALLRCIDTAALQREISRRTALTVVAEHRDELVETADADPTPENLRDLALAELAMGHYLEAMLAAERLADEQLALRQAEPGQSEAHREQAINAYLLVHEAAKLAGRVEDAIKALETAASLVDREAEPVLWADLHEPLAEFLLDHAHYDRAEELIDQITDIREDHHVTGDPALPNGLLLWCRLLSARSRHNDAVAVARRVGELIREESPFEAARWATALSGQAFSLLTLGHFRDAEPLMRRALAIGEASYGPEHPNVAIRLNNLAGLLQATNRLAEAEPLLRRALAIDEASYGADHPSVAGVLSNLAQLLQATNRLEESEPLLRRALATDEASYGPEHPDVATRLNNLAGLLRATNRLAEAEPLLRRALVIDETSYGSDHPDVARDLNNLALLLQATNRLAEAEALLRRALAIDEASYGPDHPHVATDLNNLASLLHATNRMAEAEPLLRRALAIDEALYGPEHPDVARDLNNLAGLLSEMKRPAEAEPLMARMVSIFCDFTRRNGRPHPHLWLVIENYWGLLGRMALPVAERKQRLLQAGVDPAWLTDK